MNTGFSSTHAGFLFGAGDGIQFAARHAPWSVAVLMCRRHVIHYRSPPNPPNLISIKKTLYRKNGKKFLERETGFNSRRATRLGRSRF
jgi:hypothetical protein